MPSAFVKLYKHAGVGTSSQSQVFSIVANKPEFIKFGSPCKVYITKSPEKP